MSKIKPLGDTIRVVEWEELPASVRDIPADFNPLDDGVLMEHQKLWVAIKAALKVCPKGRRTGITFAEALDSTITAASRKSAGGDNVYYVPDVKDKGLEFIGYCAHFARVIAEAQGTGISGIEEFLFEDQDDKGNTKHITAWRIRFASVFQIVALSGRPASIRGLQGIVIIDEAAFHQDVQAVLDAATALLIWGGKIRVISSHNGVKNPFNQLVKDIEKGLYGDQAKVFTATFDDAVKNGLYERVCMMKGWKPTQEGKRDWYVNIRALYGPRLAAMREELDAIPRDGGAVAIPGVWIERAMPQERPVLRLVLDDEFVLKPDEERRSWAQDWIGRYLTPLLKTLDPTRDHVAGMDFARHRNFSMIVPFALSPLLSRDAPFAIEMQNVPVRVQEMILWSLLAGMPRFRGCALDATGPGLTLAEYTADKFGGNRIHQVVLNRKFYAEWMPKFAEAFGDSMITLPRDANLENDIRAIEDVDGIPMVSSYERKDIKDPDLFRHGDGAIAGMLAWYASANRSSAIDFTPVPGKGGRWSGIGSDEERDDDLADLPDMETGTL